MPVWKRPRCLHNHVIIILLVRTAPPAHRVILHAQVNSFADYYLYYYYYYCSYLTNILPSYYIPFAEIIIFSGNIQLFVYNEYFPTASSLSVDHFTLFLEFEHLNDFAPSDRCFLFMLDITTVA